jgi:hypothetical protein
MKAEFRDKLILTKDVENIMATKKLIFPETRMELQELSMCGTDEDTFVVEYDVENHGKIVEATVTKCKNGVSVNYTDIYMRRRDPDCLVVADDHDTDKARYFERYGEDFTDLRKQTFEWLNKQETLIIVPFMAGGVNLGFPALLIAPENAGFFAAGLADLQGFIPKSQIPDDFKPVAIIFLAPTFRHTHFKGEQVVVHNRTEEVHELFSFNLYPGPSAKKGVYGFLLHIGEMQGWLTLHGASVKMTTPYDNEFVMMHEGASGSGKSEILEEVRREPDGRVCLGINTVTNEKLLVSLADTCELQPITDDMALCHPLLQTDTSNKLVITDAEYGWFLRLDQVKEYGTDPHLEKLTIHPPEPLIFFNLDGKPKATCLLWEHTMDAPGVPCPNPRVIVPRRFFKNVISEPTQVDLRSFGVRTPPSTNENPNYGIIGYLHVLPPALAWLWRLVAPRGHNNPSIIGGTALSSEGVGSFWPFATGKMVTQANLLLEQILNTQSTRYILVPNQNVGAYKVGFMPEWIAREYFARRGSAKFKPEQLLPARCPLLGYVPEHVKISGMNLPSYLLNVDKQHYIGPEGYDKGAEILTGFFKQELEQFLVPELMPLGRQIIEIVMNNGTLEEFQTAIPKL